MKQNLKELSINLAISMLIGFFVGMVQIIVINISLANTEILIKSSIIGGVIGTIARLLFIYMIGIKQKSVIAAFISVFFVIGIISCIPSIYNYDVHEISISSVELISILIPAEFLGMGFCYYSYKRYLIFNSKLISKKMELTKINNYISRH